MLASTGTPPINLSISRYINSTFDGSGYRPDTVFDLPPSRIRKGIKPLTILASPVLASFSKRR